MTIETALVAAVILTAGWTLLTVRVEGRSLRQAALSGVKMFGAPLVVAAVVFAVFPYSQVALAAIVILVVLVVVNLASRTLPARLKEGPETSSAGPDDDQSMGKHGLR